MSRSTLQRPAAAIVLAAASYGTIAALSLPPKAHVKYIVCDADRAVLLGSERGPYLPGDPRLFTKEAVAFAAQKNAAPLRRSALGPGFIASTSRASGDTIYVVRLELGPGGEIEHGHLIKSRDLGRTWVGIPSVPSDITGAVFDTEESGYAWSTRRIHRTDDGGKSWSSITAPGPMTGGSPLPVLSRDGKLWIAVGHGAGWTAEDNMILIVNSDLEIEGASLPLPHRIRNLAADADALWALADEPDGDQALLLRASHPGQTVSFETVSSFPHAISRYLWVRGDDIVTSLGEIDGEVPRDLLNVSAGSGAAWDTTRLPEPRIDAFCVVNVGEVWMVGSSGELYEPHAATNALVRSEMR